MFMSKLVCMCVDAVNIFGVRSIEDVCVGAFNALCALICRVCCRNQSNGARACLENVIRVCAKGVGRSTGL